MLVALANNGINQCTLSRQYLGFHLRLSGIFTHDNPFHTAAVQTTSFLKRIKIPVIYKTLFPLRSEEMYQVPGKSICYDGKSTAAKYPNPRQGHSDISRSHPQPCGV